MLLMVTMFFWFALIGILSVVYAKAISKTNVIYYASEKDGTCLSTSGSYCSVTFTPNQTIRNPHLYIDIEGFYGNHRNYVKSMSASQL